jgi:putative transposase
MVRRGRGLRSVARRFGVSLSTVQRWVARAGTERLDRVAFDARPPGKASNRTDASVEAQVLAARKRLAERSDLGEHGAEAIRRELARLKVKVVPSVRTIGRILLRRGALDGRRRIRRPPPPPGWYLPGLAARRAELDSFDAVEGLVIRGVPGGRGPVGVEVFNGVSLHGGLVGSWPGTGVTAVNVAEALVAHWRAFGLPAYAQFDNAPTFAGSPAKPDTFGRVIRLCLSLGVTPVFAPPRETGFQAAIESYNGRWQAKVWARFTHASVRSDRLTTDRYVAAARLRSAARIESAPRRRPFPKRWTLDLRRPLRGRVIYLRRTDDKGRVHLLGHTFDVDATWTGRLVRVEIDFDAKQARFYALRRREPAWQPLLKTHPYEPPKRRFRE